MACKNSIGFSTLHRPTKFNTIRLLGPSSPIDWINLGYRQLTQEVSYMTHYYGNSVAPSLLPVAKVDTGSHKVQVTRDNELERRMSVESHEDTSSTSSCDSEDINLYEIYTENLKVFQAENSPTDQSQTKESVEKTKTRRTRRFKNIMTKLRLAAERPFASIDNHFI